MEEEKFNIKDGLSISEAKVSALIILCVLTFLFAFVMYVLDKDIKKGYISMIKRIEQKYPGTEIFCLRPFNGSKIAGEKLAKFLLNYFGKSYFLV